MLAFLTRTLVLIGGLLSLLIGLMMLFFYEQLKNFNDTVNETFFGVSGGERSEIDEMLFAQRYFMGLLLIIVGVVLIMMLMRYT